MRTSAHANGCRSKHNGLAPVLVGWPPCLWASPQLCLFLHPPMEDLAGILIYLGCRFMVMMSKS